MLTRIIVLLIISPIFIVIYYFAKKKLEEEKTIWQVSLEHMENDIDGTISRGLRLVGVSSDENSDPKVSDVIKTLELPDDIRIKAYD